MSKSTQTKKFTNRDIQAIERRRQILEVSKSLFAVHGYHGTSMRTINKEVGTSEALTYHYFPGGKLEILQTIIREEEEIRIKDFDEFVKSLSDEMTLEEILFHFARKTYELLIKDKEFLLILFREKNLLDQTQLTELLNTFQQSMNILIQFVEKKAVQGQLRDIDFQLAINQFMSYILTIAFEQMLFGFGSTNEDDNQIIVKIVNFTLELWAK